MREHFANDFNLAGEQRKKILGIPKGQVSFIFCKIRGKVDGVQCFVDNGCNCCILRDGIAEKEFKSYKTQEGPISINVATDIQVHATGEWACALPLQNGSHQVVRGLSVARVTADMPVMKLKPLLLTPSLN